MTNRASTRERLLAFLDTIRRPDKPISAIRDSEDLVSVGLVDSLAVLEIIMAAYESAATGRRIDLPLRTNAKTPIEPWLKSRR